MPRVSRGAAILVGGFVAVEAFFGGMIVHRAVAANATPDPALSEIAVLPDPEVLQDLQADLNVARRDVEDLQTEVAALKAQVTQGFVRNLNVTISESQTAYPLVEPKLMISVTALQDGPVLAHFGTQTQYFLVGQRADFRVKDCYCYLLLRESVRGRAIFNFGCERTDPDKIPLETDPSQSAPTGNRDDRATDYSGSQIRPI
jgi:hypothetical protein